uniref:Small nuclear ribonucleoprotein polypeptide A' n=1 Tax=Scleropages formosus TaxID=113540 RepID=A0A8C9RWZ2_SCLFO
MSMLNEVRVDISNVGLHMGCCLELLPYSRRFLDQIPHLLLCTLARYLTSAKSTGSKWIHHCKHFEETECSGRRRGRLKNNICSIYPTLQGDLDPLASIKTLTLLSLLRNPVTNKKHYRLYVINKIPQLRVLDFQKVKLKERQEAEKMFKGKRGAQLAKDIAKRSKTFTPGATLQMEKRKAGPSQADVEAIKNAIASATSLAEVERLKGLLQSGQIPGRDMRQGMWRTAWNYLNILDLLSVQSAVGWCERCDCLVVLIHVVSLGHAGMVEEEEEENEDDIAHGGAMVQMEEAAGEDDGREGEEEGGEEDDGEEMEEDTPMNGSA